MEHLRNDVSYLIGTLSIIMSKMINSSLLSKNLLELQLRSMLLTSWSHLKRNVYVLGYSYNFTKQQ